MEYKFDFSICEAEFSKFALGFPSFMIEHYALGSKNALGFSAYTGPKIVIGLRPWYKFDKRSDIGSNIENIIPVILESPSPI